jgi:hypothetical protein
MHPKKLCTYCDDFATTKDHVPPKCFFTETKPANLITVPCCHTCNKFYGDEIDTHARNTISALHNNEGHWAVSNEIAGKRDRSYTKKSGNVEYIASIVKPKEVVTPEGIILGVAPALNLNNRVMNKFFERLARGLIREVVGVRSIGYRFEWGLMDSLLSHIGSPQVLLKNVGPPIRGRDIGEDTFSYYGWFEKERPESLWVVRFYGGEEFYLFVTAHN